MRTILVHCGPVETALRQLSSTNWIRSFRFCMPDGNSMKSMSYRLSVERKCSFTLHHSSQLSGTNLVPSSKSQSLTGGQMMTSDLCIFALSKVQALLLASSFIDCTRPYTSAYTNGSAPERSDTTTSLPLHAVSFSSCLSMMVFWSRSDRVADISLASMELLWSSEVRREGWEILEVDAGSKSPG